MACYGNFQLLLISYVDYLKLCILFISSMAFGSKDLFGLELDIRVPDEEISFLDSDLWPEFVEGMNCNMQDALLDPSIP